MGLLNNSSFGKNWSKSMHQGTIMDLENQIQKLKDTIKSSESLSNMVIHDIRSPATSIIMALEKILKLLKGDDAP